MSRLLLEDDDFRTRSPAFRSPPCWPRAPSVKAPGVPAAERAQHGGAELADAHRGAVREAVHDDPHLQSGARQPRGAGPTIERRLTHIFCAINMGLTCKSCSNAIIVVQKTLQTPGSVAFQVCVASKLACRGHKLQHCASGEPRRHCGSARLASVLGYGFLALNPFVTATTL